MSRLRAPLVGGVILPAIAVVVLGVVGLLFGSFAQYVLSQIVISCLVGAALVMIIGYARVIMLATGAMMAIGAYGSAAMMLQLNVPYLATLPLALAFGFVAGLVLAMPAIRFRGHHLAMVTLVFQFLIVIVIREWSSVTGGALGLRIPPIEFLGITPTADREWLLFIVAVCAIGIAILGLLLSTRFGKILKAISDSEIAADAYGISAAQFQIAAFAISSAFLAAAGALLAPGVRILDPESFGIGHSIIALGYPIVGGMNSIWGGLIGGTLLRALPEALRSFGQYQEMWVALLAILVMIANPSGILGIGQKLLGSGRTSLRLEQSQQPVSDTAQMVTSQVSDHDEIALEVLHAWKSYDGLVAVNDVSLAVGTGKIHALIGPNGAGKTTLFNAISGFIPLDQGSVSLFGADVGSERSLTRIHRGVTRTFQQVAVFGQLSCLDNVIMGLGQNSVGQAIRNSLAEAVRTTGSQQAVERARQALAEVGLDAFRDRSASGLSLGNQRRLEIARAIVSRPRLILLDEPVSGVAHEEEEQIAELLLRLKRDHNITMLLIEHNISFVRSLCDSMSVMAAGRIIAEGDPETVVKLPVVRQQYFGELDVEAAA